MCGRRTLLVVLTALALDATIIVSQPITTSGERPTVDPGGSCGCPLDQYGGFTAAEPGLTGGDWPPADVDGNPQQRAILDDIQSGQSSVVSLLNGSGAQTASNMPTGTVELEGVSDDGSERTTNRTDMISGTLSGGAPNGTVSPTALSSDGATAAFISTATNRYSDDPNTHAQVYLHDLTRKAPLGIPSVAVPSIAPLNASADSPSIVGEATPSLPLGVAYESAASNLGPDTPEGCVYNVAAKATTPLRQRPLPDLLQRAGPADRSPTP
ncbi:MAG TPA: hypothetical protein VHX88_17925 [Solirubrobacteraceae bacterium]|jgi:hypothetical protein|nr:hypothetical protein [Solirubrobacteraceae bacterium]